LGENGKNRIKNHMISITTKRRSKAAGTHTSLNRLEEDKTTKKNTGRTCIALLLAKRGGEETKKEGRYLNSGDKHSMGPEEKKKGKGKTIPLREPRLQGAKKKSRKTQFLDPSEMKNQEMGALAKLWGDEGCTQVIAFLKRIKRPTTSLQRKIKQKSPHGTLSG